ncbi:MAG: N-glycosylase/DNA lyase, partial [Caldisphaera sp.]|nr:N-glycosylase/DNA lyase [Caldisphaera sp.]
CSSDLIKIPLPIDLRISCITYTSNLIDAESYKKILSSPKMAIYAWDCISEKSGVPQIHLDSLLWTIGWIPRNMGIKEGRKKVVDILKNISDEEKSEKIAEQFLIKECR